MSRMKGPFVSLISSTLEISCKLITLMRAACKHKALQKPELTFLNLYENALKP